MGYISGFFSCLSNILSSIPWFCSVSAVVHKEAAICHSQFTLSSGSGAPSKWTTRAVFLLLFYIFVLQSKPKH